MYGYVGVVSCPVSRAKPVIRVVDKSGERPLSFKKRFFSRSVPPGWEVQWARPPLDLPPVPHILVSRKRCRNTGRIASDARAL